MVIRAASERPAFESVRRQVTTGGGIKDDSASLKLLGTGISIGRRTSISFFGSEIGLDFGKARETVPEQTAILTRQVGDAANTYAPAVPEYAAQAGLLISSVASSGVSSAQGAAAASASAVPSLLDGGRSSARSHARSPRSKEAQPPLLEHADQNFVLGPSAALEEQDEAMVGSPKEAAAAWLANAEGNGLESEAEKAEHERPSPATSPARSHTLARAADLKV